MKRIVEILLLLASYAAFGLIVAGFLLAACTWYCSESFAE
jgi:hypothetical protein